MQKALAKIAMFPPHHPRKTLPVKVLLFHSFDVLFIELFYVVFFFAVAVAHKGINGGGQMSSH